MRLRERFQGVPERRLAIGGVYRVVDTVRRETVMLKVVAGPGQDSLERARRMSEVLVGLRHPNVERVLEGFATEEGWCMVMERIDETSLGGVMQDGRIPLPRLRLIIIQTLRALAYLHSQGVVHRSVNPRTIVVGPQDHVRVTNPNEAQIAGLGDIARPAVGNPRYMAPEQIEGKVLDGRADLCSLGVVLYEALTGRHPFEARDPMNVVFGHVRLQPQPPQSVTPAVPREWSDLTLVALAKDPADRFPGAEAMERAVVSLSAS